MVELKGRQRKETEGRVQGHSHLTFMERTFAFEVRMSWTLCLLDCHLAQTP